jgi:hypothetical protein
MPGGTLVAVQIVGKEQVWSEKHTIRFVFLDFANLPDDRDESTISPAALCHGYRWQLRLYPGGAAESGSGRVYVSLDLICILAENDYCEVKAKCAFRVPLAPSQETLGASTDDEPWIFSKQTEDYWGNPDFLVRSHVLNHALGYLVNGNLTIEVDIKVYKDEAPAWRPKKTLHLDMMKILESAKQSGDVKFQVGREEFSAHRHILDARAPELAAIAKDYPSDTLIPIQDIKPSTFRSLLHFVYADDFPKFELLQSEARDLLNSADRFGCKGLKLLAEAEIASWGITVDTAADLIIFADAKNCALLKETAMDFCAANLASVRSSPGWGKVEESFPLLKELMAVLRSDKKRPAPADAEERDCKRMCVSSLRRKLDERGLDVDGSREMLVRRLEKGENDDGSPNNASV